MVGGYFVTGRRAPDELFLTVVYGLRMSRRRRTWMVPC
jgi:hypothetical protein